MPAACYTKTQLLNLRNSRLVKEPEESPAAVVWDWVHTEQPAPLLDDSFAIYDRSAVQGLWRECVPAEHHVFAQESQQFPRKNLPKYLCKSRNNPSPPSRSPTRLRAQAQDFTPYIYRGTHPLGPRLQNLMDSQSQWGCDSPTKSHSSHHSLDAAMGQLSLHDYNITPIPMAKTALAPVDWTQTPVTMNDAADKTRTAFDRPLKDWERMLPDDSPFKRAELDQKYPPIPTGNYTSQSPTRMQSDRWRLDGLVFERSRQNKLSSYIESSNGGRGRQQENHYHQPVVQPEYLTIGQLSPRKDAGGSKSISRTNVAFSQPTYDPKPSGKTPFLPFTYRVKNGRWPLSDQELVDFGALHIVERQALDLMNTAEDVEAMAFCGCECAGSYRRGRALSLGFSTDLYHPIFPFIFRVLKGSWPTSDEQFFNFVRSCKNGNKYELGRLNSYGICDCKAAVAIRKQILEEGESFDLTSTHIEGFSLKLHPCYQVERNCHEMGKPADGQGSTPNREYVEHAHALVRHQHLFGGQT